MPNALIVPIVGSTISGLIALAIAYNVFRANQAASAVAAFRSAFAPTQTFVYLLQRHGTDDRPDLVVHIREQLPKQGVAIEMFRPFISDSKRAAYQQAWEQYREICVMDKFKRQGMEGLDGETEGHLITGRIDNLLKFAD